MARQHVAFLAMAEENVDLFPDPEAQPTAPEEVPSDPEPQPEIAGSEADENVDEPAEDPLEAEVEVRLSDDFEVSEDHDGSEPVKVSVAGVEVELNEGETATVTERDARVLEESPAVERVEAAD